MLRLFRFGFGMGVTPDFERDGQPHRFAAQPDLDAGQVERVEHQLDAAPDQQRVDLVGVALQRHQRGAGDGALFFPEERLGQRVGARDRERAGDAPAGERGLTGLGVDLAVVDGLDPRGEQLVELAQVGDRVPARIALGVPGDLDQELLADGPGRLGRAARCQRGAGPFPLGLPPNRTYPFPSIRLSGDYCVSGEAGCPWIRSWQSPQTTRALRRILAMNWAHGGCG